MTEDFTLLYPKPKTSFTDLAKPGESPFKITDKDLERKDIESECVSSLEYNEENYELIIHFHRRGSYKYSDFPPDEFQQFNGAASRGKYFNLYIRDRYSFERIA